MRQIAIIIIFASLVQGCGENRKKEVSNNANHKVQTLTLSSAPTASAQKTVAVVPAKKALRNHTVKASTKTDEVTTGRAAPVIHPKKKALRAMTFNEAQFSDDASDFPRTEEALKLEKEKYND